MMSLFSNMDPMMIWLIIGALLILLELIAPGVYLFWLGIAALVTGFLLKIVDLSLTMQILSFAIFSIISVLVGVKTYKDKNADIKTKHLNQVRGSEYVGHKYTLTEPVIDNSGRLPLGDSVWIIHGENLPAGTEIQITKVVGNTLHYIKTDRPD